MVADLREYVAQLKLPEDWHKRITVQKFGDFIESYAIAYEGKPLATYVLTLLKEIEEKQYHIPIPPPPNPLVVASQLAVSQPSDMQWRRFKHLVFQRSEVMFVNNIDENGASNGKTFTICFKGGRDMLCGNEKNYANSGMSTCEFFIDHVLELRPENHVAPQ